VLCRSQFALSGPTRNDYRTGIGWPGSDEKKLSVCGFHTACLYQRHGVIAKHTNSNSRTSDSSSCRFNRELLLLLSN
jgi:hypothetical protein